MEELDRFHRRIEQHYPKLTKSEQRIASFLLSNHDQAAFLPAAELAERLDISEATIVRFAKSIGYDGFPKLRRDLQEIFRVRVTPATRLQRKLADLQSGEGHVLRKMIDMELQYLTEAEHSVSTADFDRAVQIALNAARVFVFGLGPSRLLAELVHLRLQRFGFTVYTLTESGRDLLEKLVLLKKDDAVLATGFHRVTGELTAVIQHAHTLGAKTVLITDMLAPVFKDRVDVILSARRGPVSNFHSLTVPMTILNALILAIAMARSGESLASLNHLQEMRAAYGLDELGKNS